MSLSQDVAALQQAHTAVDTTLLQVLYYERRGKPSYTVWHNLLRALLEALLSAQKAQTALIEGLGFDPAQIASQAPIHQILPSVTEG